MRKVICDIETDSLSPTKVWCVVAYDLDEGSEFIFTCRDNFKGLKDFSKTVDLWIGHNFLLFDKPALNSLLGLDIKVSQVRDTLILSRLFNYSRPKIMGVKGNHSLEYWGKKFKQFKQEHTDWSQFSDEMLERCRSDVQLNKRVWEYLRVEGKDYSDESKLLEHNIQYLLSIQQQTGFYFDQQKAHLLYSTCRQEADEIASRIHVYFRPKAKAKRLVSPRFNKDGTMSIVGLKKVEDAKNVVGGAFSLIEWVDFNLSSPSQVVTRLEEAGWRPSVFNKVSTTGKLLGKKFGTPKICEENLETLPDTAPEAAKLISKYLLLNSRCKNIQTWFEALGTDGRIHGEVQALGASTHRMSHRNPNTANIPSTYNKLGKLALYGKECRECWTIGDKINRRLVGVDASGIQLRILSHYMNDSAYQFAIINGNKDDGTDIHTVNQKAAGFATRDIAKRFIYSWLLGAGYFKIGQIMGEDARAGQRAAEQFLDALPALAAVKVMASAAFKRGYMIGIDGRRVQIPSEHKALAMYLQAGEATIMKKAYIFAYNRIKKAGLDARIVGIIHDEIQIDCLKEHAEEVGKIVVQCIVDAGLFYKLRCPLNGEAKVGLTWADTH